MSCSLGQIGVPVLAGGEFCVNEGITEINFLSGKAMLQYQCHWRSESGPRNNWDIGLEFIQVSLRVSAAAKPRLELPYRLIRQSFDLPCPVRRLG